MLIVLQWETLTYVIFITGMQVYIGINMEILSIKHRLIFLRIIIALAPN
jgi:hypothetical protein